MGQQNPRHCERSAAISFRASALAGKDRHVARFANFFDDLTQQQETAQDIPAIEIRVVVFFGSEVAPLGAHRTFQLVHTGIATRVVPTTFETIQMSSYWRRRRVKAWRRARMPALVNR